MKICGIIAEYNPLHNGHAFHIEQTRKAGATHIIAVMSGSFVQRATPALCSKFMRAELAVRNGVDLVIELPVQYAVGASERFAEGAASILHQLGCVDMLSFGSENGSVVMLNRAADAVMRQDVAARTRTLYEQGISYPAARQQAVQELVGKEIAAVLAEPNNSLGIEYIKALRGMKSAIEVFSVSRAGAAHDSEVPGNAFASASFIRSQIEEGCRDIAAYVPRSTCALLQQSAQQSIISGGLKAIERVVFYKLRTMTKRDMQALPGCADGLGNRLHRATAQAATIEALYQQTKTKRYTMSRVRRAVLCALLGIDDSYYVAPPYARILAIGGRGEEVLRRIGTAASIPVSHSIKTLRALGGDAQKTANAEIRATDIYHLTLENIVPAAQDYTAKLVRITDD